MKTPNPQGKGQVTVLSDWAENRPSAVASKSPATLLADYFISLLVLSADFGFRPRPGISYYLYRAGSGWQLSLIAPREWGNNAPGPFLGRCTLLKDMTWGLEPRDDLASNPELVAALHQLHESFIEQLGKADSLEDTLPFYVASLPYYRRLCAAGLASSVSSSLRLAGLDKANNPRWLGQLLQQADSLTISPFKNAAPIPR